MKPWEFLALNQDRQSQLAAYFDVQNEIENYYYEESSKDKPRRENER